MPVLKKKPDGNHYCIKQSKGEFQTLQITPSGVKILELYGIITGDEFTNAMLTDLSNMGFIYIYGKKKPKINYELFFKNYENQANNWLFISSELDRRNYEILNYIRKKSYSSYPIYEHLRDHKVTWEKLPLPIWDDIYTASYSPNYFWKRFSYIFAVRSDYSRLIENFVNSKIFLKIDKQLNRDNLKFISIMRFFEKDKDNTDYNRIIESNILNDFFNSKSILSELHSNKDFQELFYKKLNLIKSAAIKQVDFDHIEPYLIPSLKYFDIDKSIDSIKTDQFLSKEIDEQILKKVGNSSIPYTMIKRGQSSNVIQLLEKRYLSPTKRFNNGNTLLHMAAKKDDLPLLSFILTQLNTNIHLVNDKGLNFCFFLFRHCSNETILRTISLCPSIFQIIQKNEPIWYFSLNNCFKKIICTHPNGLPFKFGKSEIEYCLLQNNHTLIHKLIINKYIGLNQQLTSCLYKLGSDYFFDLLGEKDNLFSELRWNLLLHAIRVNDGEYFIRCYSLVHNQFTSIEVNELFIEAANSKNSSIFEEIHLNSSAQAIPPRGCYFLLKIYRHEYFFQIIDNLIFDDSKEIINYLNEGLSAAIELENLDLIKKIISMGGNVNYATKEGFTALMYTSTIGDLKTTQLLINRGADPSMETSDGYTAERLARIQGFNSIIEVLNSTNPKP